METELRGVTLCPGRTHRAGSLFRVQSDQLSCDLSPDSAPKIRQSQYLLHLLAAGPWGVTGAAEPDLGAHHCHQRWKPEECYVKTFSEVFVMLLRPETLSQTNDLWKCVLPCRAVWAKKIYCATHCCLQCLYNKWISHEEVEKME